MSPEYAVNELLRRRTLFMVMASIVLYAVIEGRAVPFLDIARDPFLLVFVLPTVPTFGLGVILFAPEKPGRYWAYQALDPKFARIDVIYGAVGFCGALILCWLLSMFPLQRSWRVFVAAYIIMSIVLALGLVIWGLLRLYPSL